MLACVPTLRALRTLVRSLPAIKYHAINSICSTVVPSLGWRLNRVLLIGSCLQVKSRIAAGDRDDNRGLAFASENWLLPRQQRTEEERRDGGDPVDPLF